MAISKVILNGVTQMDVTQTTVDPEEMLTGVTAIDRSGVEISGTLSPVTKDELFKYTGNKEIEFIEGYYIDTSGATVDINSPIESTSGYKYAVIDCVEGDTFTITGTGGTYARPWCFIDASGNALRTASADVSITDYLVSAPVGSAKLVVNAKNDEKCYYGKDLVDRFNDVENGGITQVTKNYINLVPNTYEIFSESNKRKLYFYGNTFGTIGSTGGGSTYYSALLNKKVMKPIMGNNTAIASNLTATDFSPIYFSSNNTALFVDISFRGIDERSNSHGAGYLVAATYNTTTTEIKVINVAGAFGLTYGTMRCLNLTANLTAILPEIIENGNFALIYQSRYADVTEEWTINLRLETYSFTSAHLSGSTHKSIAYQEARLVATKNYSPNDIFTIGPNLYRVTDSITTGSTIVNGTNAEYTTLGDLITDNINNKITKPSTATSGQFLVYDGSDWVAQSLSTWSGGSY